MLFYAKVASVYNVSMNALHAEWVRLFRRDLLRPITNYWYDCCSMRRWSVNSGTVWPLCV